MADHKEAVKQVGFGVLGNAVYAVIVLILGSLVALFVSQGEGQRPMTRADWVVYTLGSAVAFTIAFCGAVWSWPRVRAIWQEIYSRRAAESASTSPEDGRVIPEKPEPFVEFTLPSNWTPGFRHRKMGTHEATGEWIQAEEVNLRIVAKRRMQNVRFEMIARGRRADHWEELARIGSETFAGTVQKEVEQSFVVMQRSFWQPPVSFEHDGATQQGRSRAEMGMVFFPENPAAFPGEIGGQYLIQINVFHDDGPEKASFTVQLDKKRYFPLSQIIGRDNIEPVITH